MAQNRACPWSRPAGLEAGVLPIKTVILSLIHSYKLSNLEEACTAWRPHPTPYALRPQAN